MEAIMQKQGWEILPLTQFMHLDAKLAEIYTTDERALWWHRAHPMLEASAIEVLLSGQYKHVERVINQLDGMVAT